MDRRLHRLGCFHFAPLQFQLSKSESLLPQLLGLLLTDFCCPASDVAADWRLLGHRNCNAAGCSNHLAIQVTQRTAALFETGSAVVAARCESSLYCTARASLSDSQIQSF